MPEARMPTPENTGDDFDIETQDAGGHGRGIAVEGAGLVWNHGEGPHRRAFEDIATIDLQLVRGEDTYVRCDIGFIDGTSLTAWATSDKANDFATYRVFVLRFFARLGPAHRARIRFREGLRPTRRMATIIAGLVGLVCCLGVFVFLLSSEEQLREDDGWLMLPLILLIAALCAGISWHGWRSDQKTFDPESTPDHVLPSAPRQGPRR